MKVFFDNELQSGERLYPRRKRFVPNTNTRLVQIFLQVARSCAVHNTVLPVVIHTVDNPVELIGSDKLVKGNVHAYTQSTTDVVGPKYVRDLS